MKKIITISVFCFAMNLVYGQEMNTIKKEPALKASSVGAVSPYNKVTIVKHELKAYSSDGGVSGKEKQLILEKRNINLKKSKPSMTSVEKDGEK